MITFFLVCLIFLSLTLEHKQLECSGENNRLSVPVGMEIGIKWIHCNKEVKKVYFQHNMVGGFVKKLYLPLKQHSFQKNHFHSVYFTFISVISFLKCKQISNWGIWVSFYHLLLTTNQKGTSWMWLLSIAKSIFLQIWAVLRARYLLLCWECLFPKVPSCGQPLFLSWFIWPVLRTVQLQISAPKNHPPDCRSVYLCLFRGLNIPKSITAANSCPYKGILCLFLFLWL